MRRGVAFGHSGTTDPASVDHWLVSYSRKPALHPGLHRPCVGVAATHSQKPPNHRHGVGWRVFFAMSLCCADQSCSHRRGVGRRAIYNGELRLRAIPAPRLQQPQHVSSGTCSLRRTSQGCQYSGRCRRILRTGPSRARSLISFHVHEAWHPRDVRPFLLRGFQRWLLVPVLPDFATVWIT